MGQLKTLQIPVKDVPNFTARLAMEFPKMVSLAMYESLRLIGLVATSKYMIQTGTGAGSKLAGVGSPVAKDKLTMRSGRLARSLVGQSGFSGPGAAGGPDKIGTREGFMKVTREGSRWVGRIGTNVPYAARHEFGGDYPITKRQMGFFYGRYKETGDKMWIAMYAKGKKGGVIITPRRPFLGPATTDPETIQGIDAIFINQFNMMAAKVATPGAKK